MPIDNWVHGILAITAIPAIPVLEILSFQGWRKALRRELPAWRRRLGLTSIVITFLSWYTAILLSLGGMVSERWVELLALMALAGTILGFSLKGPSRIEAIAAGFLMLAGVTYSVS